MLRKVLIVEDDYAIAMEFQAACEAAHCLVMGPVATEVEALDLLSHDVPDIAIVDLNLGGGLTIKVASMLRDHAIPFCFATGYDREMIPGEYMDVPHLQKPVDGDAIVRAIRELVRQ